VVVEAAVVEVVDITVTVIVTKRKLFPIYA
jgi:hypothetical protein